MVRFVCTCYFGRLHFEQSHKERERGFSSLIFVRAIRVKSVFASACHWIVKWDPEIVPPEKPAKDPASLLKPLAFFC